MASLWLSVAAETIAICSYQSEVTQKGCQKKFGNHTRRYTDLHVHVQQNSSNSILWQAEWSRCTPPQSLSVASKCTRSLSYIQNMYTTGRCTGAFVLSHRWRLLVESCHKGVGHWQKGMPQGSVQAIRNPERLKLPYFSGLKKGLRFFPCTINHEKYIGEECRHGKGLKRGNFRLFDFSMFMLTQCRTETQNRRAND